MRHLRPIQTLAAASLLALTSSSVRGVTLPAAEDTTSAKTTITKAANTATSLTVNGAANVDKKALIQFNLGDVPAGKTAADVLSARFRIYISKVTKAGALTVHKITGAWDEGATGTTPTPAFEAAAAAAIAGVDVETKHFVSVDVTQIVKDWITTPLSNEGLIVKGDATVAAANITLGSKEGTGTGHPAELEIEFIATGAAGPAGPPGPQGPAGPATVGSVTTASIVDGNVTAAKLDPGIGVFAASGGNVSLASGRLGIGTNNPQAALDVAGGNMRVTGTGLTASIDLTPFDPNPNDPQTRIQATDDGNFSGHLDLMTKPTGANGANLLATRMRITSGGNVGIGTGTSSPNGLLHVNGTGVTDDGKLVVQTAGGQFGPQLRLAHTGAGGEEWVLVSNGSINQGGVGLFDIVQVSSASSRFTIAANGNVGIGTVPGAFKLDVNGGIRCIGAVDTTSDARYKMDIRPVASALETIGALRGVSYDWNHAGFPEKSFPQRRSLGFIAQEVEKVLPQVVTKDENGFYSVSYSEVIPVLVEAAKELRAENAALREQLKALEARDRAREARLTRLEAALDDRPARTVSASLDLE